MITPLATARSVTWLTEPPARSGDLRASALVPAYPAYVRVENRIEEPLVGLIDAEILATMLPVLLTATATADLCYFAMWTGYNLQGATALIDLGDLRYSLWSGSVSDVQVFGEVALGQTPNYWWPDDRAWCVVSHVDLPVSVVGCSADTATALEVAVGLAARRLPPDGLVVDRGRLDMS